MSFYTASGIRAWDIYTMEEDKISSLQLMEQAADAFCTQFQKDFPSQDISICVICGPGNNGGDGYAITRILRDHFYDCSVIEIKSSNSITDDAATNRARLLKKKNVTITSVSSVDDFPNLNTYDITIDSIFGTGLSRIIEEPIASIISHINNTSNYILSVDIPSGLFVDKYVEGTHIQADICYSFQSFKYSMLFKEVQAYAKKTTVIPIDLSEKYSNPELCLGIEIKKEQISNTFREREKFTHKGSYGHALFVGGTEEMMGAALLTSTACMRTGCGRLTAHIPDTGKHAFNLTLPEAMCLHEAKSHISKSYPTQNYSAVAIGPGMGVHQDSIEALKSYLSNTACPVVLDADALNIISKTSLDLFPKDCIITPHPGEFTRLFGESHDSIERHQLQIEMSKRYKICILLKGAHSCLTSPEGNSYFLTIGNPGMATAGSGDVLTGIILSLLTQGHSIIEAGLASMYLHALAGDLAANTLGQNSIIASDIISYIPQSIMKIQSNA